MNLATFSASTIPASTRTLILLFAFIGGIGAFSVQAAGQTTVEEIKQDLQSNRLVVRWLMLAELEKNGPYSPELVPLLLERLTLETGVRYELTIQVLGRIGADATAAVPELTRLAAQGNPDAIRALGRIGPNASEAIPTLEKLLTAENGITRVRAAVALWRIDARPEAMCIIEEAVRQRPTGCSKYFMKVQIAELGSSGKHLILEPGP